MKKDQGIKKGMLLIFRFLTVLILLIQISAFVGIMGMGNKYINLAIQGVLLLFSIFFLINAYHIVIGRLIGPISEIENAVKSMAKGDLSAEITYDEDNELGSLARNFRISIADLKVIITDLTQIIGEFAKGNFDVEVEHKEAFIGEYEAIYSELQHMVAVISNTIHHIDNVAKQVSDGSNDLAGNSQSLSTNFSEQASVTAGFLASVTEVSSQLTENTMTTEQAYNAVKNIEEQAQISRQKMEELTVAMKNIYDASGEIEKIIVDIEDIATQTNLLSLNAAIEAARAGEAGKGFAVVADEIRKLAEDSSMSATNTTELISKSLKEIEKGHRITTETSQSLTHVLNEIENMVSAVENIQAASEKQAASMKSIEKNINSINMVIQSSSASAHETSATSEELSAQAVSLKELVSQFRLLDEDN